MTETRSEIWAIAQRLVDRVPDAMNRAQAAINRGDSVDAFRTEIMACLPSVQPVRAAQPLDVKPKDWERYSISRAILSQISGVTVDAGFEREISQEISMKQRAKPTGVFIPEEAFLSKRNFVAGTGTLGGNIVETSVYGDQFIDLLRNRAQVMALGARSINLDNPVTIPRQAGAGSTNWLGETTAATLSTGNFDQITLTPFGLSAFQQYSKQLLVTGNPSIDSLIRDDIIRSIALEIDRVALHGTGSGQPRGVANTTGINSVALAANGLGLNNSTAYPFLVSLETEVATDNADIGSLAYLARPEHRGALRTVQRFSSTDTPVWEPGNTVNGYRAEVTGQIATNLTTGTATTICSAIFFGNWNDLLIANFNGGATDVIVDPYTSAANAVIRIIARRWCDIGLRHPESFCVGGGIL